MNASVCDSGDSDPEDLASVVLNADGVYIVSIAALVLTLKLSVSGYYTSHSPDRITQSEVKTEMSVSYTPI